MSDERPVHLRTPDELTAEEQLELERALDSGVTDLPPNQPRGLLGETGIDVRKVDDFKPDLNGGIIQENDLVTVWLGIVLAYLLVFPLAYVLLWRSTRIPAKTKWIASAIGAAGILAVSLLLLVG